METNNKKKEFRLISRFPSAQRFSFFLLAIILVFYILIQARLFLYPIAVAVLFTYLLYPFTNWLEKHRFPRIIAILISLILLLGIIGAAGVFIYRKIGGFMDDFPAFRSKALENIDILELQISKLVGIENLSIPAFVRDRVSALFDTGSDFLNKVFSATAGTVFRLGIMPVLIFMLLYFRTKFAYFILKLVPQEKQMVTIKVLREVSTVASRYMGGMLTVVFVLCIINSSLLYLLGLKYAIILGVIAGIWSFIPYFGTIIGYAFPFVFAFLTGDSPNMALKVLLIYIIVHFTESNIITPNIVGSYVNLNVFIIILGMIAAGLVWGLPGMFVIVPFLAMLRVMCEHVESLQPYVYLLGTKGVRKHALTGENINKFLQRIRGRKSTKV
jgi:predicted PurR-regulated permease PerM